MKLVGFIEECCGKYGELNATHPKRAIAFSFMTVAIFSIGLMSLKRELRTDKLWVSQDSEYIKVNLLTKKIFGNFNFFAV